MLNSSPIASDISSRTCSYFHYKTTSVIQKIICGFEGIFSGFGGIIRDFGGIIATFLRIKE